MRVVLSLREWFSILDIINKREMRRLNDRLVDAMVSDMYEERPS